MNRRISKSSLFLMELIMAILFFAIATIVCVQLFVKSHVLSEESVRLNYAVNWCSILAEGFYACDADMEAMNESISNSFLSEDGETIYLYFSKQYTPLTSGEDSKDSRFFVRGKLIREDKFRTLNIECYDKIKKEIVYSLEPKLYPKLQH